jgi:hypothetical protein
LEREAKEVQIKEQKKKEVEKTEKIEAKKAEKKKAEELGPIIYLADKIVKSKWGGAAGDKPAMKKMAASMKKGKVSGEILEEVLWAYMFHADSTARAAAKKAFMELAPEDAVQAVKKNWKASSRNSNKLGTDLGRLGKSLGQTSISLVNLLIKVLKDNRGSEARVYQMKSTVMYPSFPTIEALGIIGDVRAAEPLGVTLKKWITIGSWSDRYAAVVTIIETLGKVGDVRVLEPLTKALELKILNGNTLKKIHTKHVVSSVKKALKNLEKRGKLDESAVEPLIEMLKSNRARSVAVSLLGRVGDKRAVKPLIEVLGDDKLSVIKAAAGALGKLGDERAVKPLFKTFEDGNLGLIKVAAMAIVKIKEADIVDEEKKNILKFLKSKDPAMVLMGASLLKGAME